MFAHDPVFAEYHRAERRHVAVIVGGWLVAIGLAVAGIVAIGVTVAPAQVAAAGPVLPAETTSDAVPTSSASTAPTPTASPSTASKAAAPPPAAAAPRTDHFSIRISATGYQTELDACQWVRMNLGATGPIVGAHTRCGGAIVLGMQQGDTVQLVGQGLDGSYRVADARDAHSGDIASTATAGMTADVILQTCYPNTGGRERLIGLIALGQ